MSCITEACHLTIPEFAQKSHRCTVPGWNDYVDEKHSVAIKCIFRLGGRGHKQFNGTSYFSHMNV
jgi:hypothetical protein